MCWCSRANPVLPFIYAFCGVSPEKAQFIEEAVSPGKD
jgi:hypothetical protein